MSDDKAAASASESTESTENKASDVTDDALLQLRTKLWKAIDFYASARSEDGVKTLWNVLAVSEINSTLNAMLLQDKMHRQRGIEYLCKERDKLRSENSELIRDKMLLKKEVDLWSIQYQELRAALEEHDKSSKRFLESVKDMTSTTVDDGLLRIHAEDLRKLQDKVNHLSKQRDDLHAYAGKLLDERVRPAEGALREFREVAASLLEILNQTVYIVPCDVCKHKVAMRVASPTFECKLSNHVCDECDPNEINKQPIKYEFQDKVYASPLRLLRKLLQSHG